MDFMVHGQKRYLFVLNIIGLKKKIDTAGMQFARI